MPQITKWVPTTNIGQLRVLGKAVEETGELTQVLARCIIQGIEEKDPSTHKVNRQWLEEEIADVYATLQMATIELDLDLGVISSRCQDKVEKLKEWRRLLDNT